MNLSSTKVNNSSNSNSNGMNNKRANGGTLLGDKEKTTSYSMKNLNSSAQIKPRRNNKDKDSVTLPSQQGQQEQGHGPDQVQNLKHPHYRATARHGIVNKHRHTRRQGHSFWDLTQQWLTDSKRISHLEESLYQTLKSRGIFETVERSKLRIGAVEHLDELLQRWNDDVRLQQNNNCCCCNDDKELQHLMSSNETSTKTCHVKHNGLNGDGNDDRSGGETIMSSLPTLPKCHIELISFGSYRLGVHAANSDLDLLALCPNYISKHDFFHSFVHVLKQDVRCTAIHPVAKAYTPVIKFHLDGIPVDLLFVQLTDDECLMTTRPQEKYNEDEDDDDDDEKETDPPEGKKSSSLVFKIEDGMLRGLDEPSSRSLNGVRVAQYLLSILSHHEQQRNFRLVLRTVKEWATVHGLYSNVLGFLGGINWAILVAWVCKRNPRASVPVLLKIFFHTFARWRWPKPVILTPVLKNPPVGVTPLTIWDPVKNPRDKAQIMPIITPCYPSMNSSYNVAQPQLRRIREELYRADEIMDQIANGDSEWTELFKENDFFTDHIHYLQVRIIATSQEHHRAWFGLCESRLRILIAGLEESMDIHAYPFTKFFLRKENDPQSDKEEDEQDEKPLIVTYFFIALRFAQGIDSVDLMSSCSEFIYAVNSWENRKRDMDLQITHVLQKNLPDFVFQSANEDAVGVSNCNLADDPKEHASDGDEKPTDTTLERNTHQRRVHCNPILREMDSPNKCLASPMKRAKIGTA